METIYAILLAILVILSSIYYFREFLIGLLHMSRHRREALPVQSDQVGNPVGTCGKKVLTVYFSWGGNTRKTAFRVHDLAGGDIAEIRVARTYPDDYKGTTNRAQEEKIQRQRPDLQPFAAVPADYDILLLGYHLWWGTVPMAVRTFLESHHLDGKVICPFATSGGGTMEDSVEDLRLSAPEADVQDGQMLNRLCHLKPWLKRNGLLL